MATTTNLNLILALPLLMLASSCPVIAEAKSLCPGPEDYREVWSSADLAAITDDMRANNSPALRYRQCTDITLPADGFLPIGYRPDGMVVSGGFKGEYLGQGFSIIGHTAPAGFTGRFGLFKELDGARVSNLRLRNSHHQGVTQTGTLASVIQDSFLDNITISDAHIGSLSPDTGLLAGIVTGSVLTGIQIHGTVGALAGMSRTISESSLARIDLEVRRDPVDPRHHFSGLADNLHRTSVHSIKVQLDAHDSSGLEDIAGAVREASESTLSQVLVTRSRLPVAGNRIAGVIVKATAGTVIERARVYAQLDGDWLVGGIVARAEGATIRDCLFEGSLESTELAGGIVASASVGLREGELYGTTIERCSVRNTSITGSAQVGGVAGVLYSAASAVVPSVIRDCMVQAALSHGPTLYAELGGIVASPDPVSIRSVIFSGTIAHSPYTFSGPIVAFSSSQNPEIQGIYNQDLLEASNGYGTPASDFEMRQSSALYDAFNLQQTWRFTPGAYPQLRSIRALRTDVSEDLETTAQDLFAFLSLYFAGSAAADFHEDGVLSAIDIFEFLSAWFGQ